MRIYREIMYRRSWQEGVENLSGGTRGLRQGGNIFLP